MAVGIGICLGRRAGRDALGRGARGHGADRREAALAGRPAVGGRVAGAADRVGRDAVGGGRADQARADRWRGLGARAEAHRRGGWERLGQAAVVDRWELAGRSVVGRARPLGRPRRLLLLGGAGGPFGLGARDRRIAVVGLWMGRPVGWLARLAARRNEGCQQVGEARTGLAVAAPFG